jgi:K+/H+ antiporter YhaU regulatory subunit KhtT
MAVMPNPKSMTILQAEDRVGLIGEKEQIEVVEKLLTAADQHAVLSVGRK